MYKENQLSAQTSATNDDRTDFTAVVEGSIAVSLDANVEPVTIALVVVVAISVVVVSACTVLVDPEEHEAMKMLVSTARLRRIFIVCTFL
jgi:uncharacterized membrane protein